MIAPFPDRCPLLLNSSAQLLTTSLVYDSLKFQTRMLQIHLFLLLKYENLDL